MNSNGISKTLPFFFYATILIQCPSSLSVKGDLEYLETCPGGEPGLRDRLRNVLSNDFVRLTYTELVELVRRDAAAGKVRFWWWLQ